MARIKGNFPKCIECKHYKEKEDGEACVDDGFCYCTQRNRIDCSGNKRDPVPERMPTIWNGCCKWWIDAETGENHFHAMTGKTEKEAFGDDWNDGSKKSKAAAAADGQQTFEDLLKEEKKENETNCN